MCTKTAHTQKIEFHALKLSMVQNKKILIFVPKKQITLAVKYMYFILLT